MQSHCGLCPYHHHHPSSVRLLNLHSVPQFLRHLYLNLKLRRHRSSLSFTSPARSSAHRFHLLAPSMSDSASSYCGESFRSDCNGNVKAGSVGVDYAEIVVVRHGETEWNSDGRIQGHLDIELNEAGKQQAVAVANRLSKDGKISVIYSSDLKRAFDTAEAIAAACGELQVVTDADLRERNLGDLQGLQLKEAANIKPLAYKAFLSDRTDQELPGGGESIDQLYQRCTSSLQRIANKHKGERVVVVTHGGVIRSLYRRACTRGRPGKVLNTSVSIFHLSDGDKWSLKSWGDVSHLTQTGFLKTGFGGDRTSG